MLLPFAQRQRILLKRQRGYPSLTHGNLNENEPSLLGMHVHHEHNEKPALPGEI